MPLGFARCAAQSNGLNSNKVPKQITGFISGTHTVARNADRPATQHSPVRRCQVNPKKRAYLVPSTAVGAPGRENRSAPSSAANLWNPCSQMAPMAQNQTPPTTPAVDLRPEDRINKMNRIQPAAGTGLGQEALLVTVMHQPPSSAPARPVNPVNPVWKYSVLRPRSGAPPGNSCRTRLCPTPVFLTSFDARETEGSWMRITAG
jgi:hypothetical protein